MRNIRLLPIAVVLTAVYALLAGCSAPAPMDMTGAPYSEIEAYRQTHPDQTVTYTVTIDDSLQLTEQDTAVTLTDAAQVQSLMAQADYLQQLTDIHFGDTVPTAQQVLDTRSAFPNAAVTYRAVALLDAVYPADTTELTLTPGQTEEAAAVLPVLPLLTDIDLDSSISLDAASALHAALPHLTYHYSVELFGQTLSTDMETVEYFKVSIGDKGLEQLRKLLPMMHSLTKLTLDWCETSDEAMAQLRADFADDFKVVWRVFIGYSNCLTDTYKFWVNGILDYQVEALKYCSEIKYMDIGHSQELTDISFVAHMPDLEVLILGDCVELSNIEPLRGCTKLEYLELYDTNVSDLTPLENLTALEHLNISGIPAADISCLNGLQNMKRLWSNYNPRLVGQVQAFQTLYPDCQTCTTELHALYVSWRLQQAGTNNFTPRYALLREQIGYDRNDRSYYPFGYLREEITYESTGIDPT